MNIEDIAVDDTCQRSLNRFYNAHCEDPYDPVQKMRAISDFVSVRDWDYELGNPSLAEYEMQYLKDQELI